MDYYKYIMALHVIFVICWFAPLFYMPRLLIYHVEANEKQEPERSILSKQLKIMQKRLWNIIAWPSMVLTWLFGIWMLALNTSALLSQPWFILKLIFVAMLTLYHIMTHIIFRQQQKDIFKWTSFNLRLWNEVATLLLFAIIFLVIPKQNSTWVWLTLVLFFLAVSIFTGVVLYKHFREKNEKKDNLPKQNP